MAAMAEKRLNGSCLCGAVRYEFEGPVECMASCHCSMCRKHHGAAFATYVGCPNERLRVTAGEEVLRTYASSPSVARRFCGTCGSSLFWAEASGSHTWVAAGTLDVDPGARPTHHIFASTKAPWHTITDALPQFDEYPPR